MGKGHYGIIMFAVLELAAVCGVMAGILSLLCSRYNNFFLVLPSGGKCATEYEFSVETKRAAFGAPVANCHPRELTIFDVSAVVLCSSILCNCRDFNSSAWNFSLRFCRYML